MIRFTAKITGVPEVTRNIRAGIANVRREVAAELNTLGNLLLRKVKEEKLNGQVLNRRTGTLGRSVNREPSTGVRATGNAMAVSVGSNVWYGRMWELTGHKEILPKKGKWLIWKDKSGWHKVKSVAAQGPRPWLQPALTEIQPEVVARLEAAVQRGIAAGPGR